METPAAGSAVTYLDNSRVAVEAYNDTMVSTDDNVHVIVTGSCQPSILYLSLKFCPGMTLIISRWVFEICYV